LHNFVLRRQKYAIHERKYVTSLQHITVTQLYIIWRFKIVRNRWNPDLSKRTQAKIIHSVSTSCSSENFSYFCLYEAVSFILTIHPIQ